MEPIAVKRELILGASIPYVVPSKNRLNLGGPGQDLILQPYRPQTKLSENIITKLWGPILEPASTSEALE